jgi:hypothetical protein
VSDVTHKADPSSPGGSASPGAGVSSRRGTGLASSVASSSITGPGAGLCLLGFGVATLLINTRILVELGCGLYT